VCHVTNPLLRGGHDGELCVALSVAKPSITFTGCNAATRGRDNYRARGDYFIEGESYATTFSAACLALAGLLVLTPSASARTGAIATSDGAPPGGVATFYDYGEHLKVCDNKSDGLRAISRYTTSNDLNLHEIQAAGGKGDCESVNLSIPEKGSITFDVCLRNGVSGALRSCNPFVTFSADPGA
jgi:hypothetical protein